jgi:nucleotide-binding universal stress UspA family protein
MPPLEEAFARRMLAPLGERARRQSRFLRRGANDAPRSLDVLERARDDMWLTKTILVPTDFGPSSRAASDVALELAQEFQVPLTVMHAVSIPAVLYTGTPVVTTGDYITSLEDAARSTLDAEVARLGGKGVQVRGVLKTGVAWEEILGVAKEVRAGLVVMGTHGRRGLPRAVIGSVTEKIVRLSQAPVLTIHAPEAERPT